MSMYALYIHVVNYPLGYFHDTLHSCRIGTDDVSLFREVSLTFVNHKLFPLEGFVYNFISAP